MKGYRPCLDCGKLIRTGGRHRCPTCLEANPKANNAGRRGARWRRIRTQVLERDGHTCQLCGAAATEVDHIVPLWQLTADDPRREHPDNLRAICGPCNRARSNPYGRGTPPPPRRQVSDLDKYLPDAEWRHPAPCHLRDVVPAWPREQWRPPHPEMAAKRQPWDVHPGPDGRWWWPHIAGPAAHSLCLSHLGDDSDLVWFSDDGFMHFGTPCRWCATTNEGTPWADIAPRPSAEELRARQRAAW